MFNNIRERLLLHSNEQALICKDASLKYKEMVDLADSLCSRLKTLGCQSGTRVAFLGTKMHYDYISILSILFFGGAYVPINSRLPIDKILFILKKSGTKVLLIDNSTIHLFLQLDTVQLADNNISSIFNVQTKETLWSNEKQESSLFDNGAYIMFTSGTTGEPKGVPITRTMLDAYFGEILSNYPIFTSDIVVNTCELSFDVSVHEIFIAWLSGASLLVIDNSSSLLAHRYVQKYGATVWSSVPSVVSIAAKAKQMQAKSMSTIRLAFFCGEALTKEVVNVIFEASPICEKVVNLWGPTEATIAFTHYPILPTQNFQQHNIMPIGRPFEGQEILVYDNLNERVTPIGDQGELFQRGSQVIDAYWESPELSEGRFITIDGQIYYRCGDLVRFDGDIYFYLGRVDRQIKYKGYRIELQDLESSIRNTLDEKLVCVVPVNENNTISGLVAFVATEKLLTSTETLDLINSKLPGYIKINEIRTIEHMPLNLNGKIDYNILTKMVN